MAPMIRSLTVWWKASFKAVAIGSSAERIR
jgi:hypothetical protein